MRKLSGRDQREMVKGLINDELISGGYNPLSPYIKPVMIDDNPVSEIRHLCNNKVLKLGMHQYTVPEYVPDGRDRVRGYIEGEQGARVYTVYYCPYCGKIYMIGDDYGEGFNSF